MGRKAGNKNDNMPNFTDIAEAMGWEQVSRFGLQTKLRNLEAPCRNFSQCARLLGCTLYKVRLALDMAMTQAKTGKVCIKRGMGRPPNNPVLTETAADWMISDSTLRSQVGLTLNARCMQVN
jgi:hypothetical protein